MKIIIVLAFLVFTGCAGSNQFMKKAEETLTSNTWVLKTIYQDNNNVQMKEPVAFIQFDTGKKNAGGKGGCNTYGAKYNLQENKISFSNTYSTKMYCQEYQQAEDKYFEALGKVNRYNISDTSLTMYKDQQLLLEFSKK